MPGVNQLRIVLVAPDCREIVKAKTGKGGREGSLIKESEKPLTNRVNRHDFIKTLTRSAAFALDEPTAAPAQTGPNAPVGDLPVWNLPDIQQTIRTPVVPGLMNSRPRQAVR